MEIMQCKKEEILTKIDRLKRFGSIGNRGYWREQLLFLEKYIADGKDSDLLRYAMEYLKVDPMTYIEDVDGFYDSSAYISSSEDTIFTKVSKDNIRRKIMTFNFDKYRIQYPVPNKNGKLDSHNLVVYSYTDATRLLFILNDNSVEVTKYTFTPSWKRR